MNQISAAQMYAEAAHNAVGQRRKYTGEPYWVHTQEVASIVAQSRFHVGDYAGFTYGVCAAHLHDVVEDTQVTLADIERHFGKVVARLVEQLTDVSRPEDGNRAARKAIDLAHTANACPLAQTIKLADLISNTRSIVEHDPAFAKVYLVEKAALLKVLVLGDQDLRAQATELLKTSCEALGIEVPK